MSRAALSVLPCRCYPPSSRTEMLTPSPFTTRERLAHPVPARFIPANGSSGHATGAAGGGVGEARTDAVAVVANVTTSGSTMDRILGVAVSSLSITQHDGSKAAAAAAEGEASVPSSIATATDDINTAESTGWAAVTEDSATNGPSPSVTSKTTLPLRSLSETHFEQAMSLVLAGAFDAISAARLRWRDVANLRVYYCCPATTSTGGDRAPGQGTAAVLAGGGVHEEMVKRAMFLALAGATQERPAITFVPVSGLQNGAAVSVHATAWSLDRLRTELWVRGAA